MGGTRTLRSSCPSLAGGWSSVPGCPPSSETTRTAMPAPRHARITPVPAPSPGRRARRRPCSPGTCATATSPTRSISRPSAPLTASPGARAYYDELRARGTSHHAALRQLASRLAGILHGCLKTGTTYDEATAWPAPAQRRRLTTKRHGVSTLVRTHTCHHQTLRSDPFQWAGSRRCGSSLGKLPAVWGPSALMTVRPGQRSAGSGERLPATAVCCRAWLIGG